MQLQTDIRTWQPPAGITSDRDRERFGCAVPAPKLAPNLWVRLFNPPTAFSFDEARLLCQHSEDKWLAWIPDHGEILLNTNEFCAT
ncbi:MAG: hypothetical protein WBA89_00965 [Microcoleus sp.]|uniref:hypothetical protein n=1 Tax=Microcoleaceae TaxID=1892252 RepID=UPI0018817FDD|nr:hypothetical protein [Tychonema sp. LEGE 06208]MBE9165077.1 hypothetical protein [Tychonema sp. LEGE 06208]